MKSFAIFLIIGALVMTEGAKLLQRWQVVMRSQQIELAVQRVNEAKAAFSRDNAANDNALQSYNDATAEERAETLIDLGLISDKNAMCLVDCGALDEAPHARTPAQLDAAAHEERLATGNSMTLAMR